MSGPPAGRTLLTIESRLALNAAIFASTSAWVWSPEVTSACSFAVKSASSWAFTSAMSTFFSVASAASDFVCSSVWSSVTEMPYTLARPSVANGAPP